MARPDLQQEQADGYLEEGMIGDQVIGLVKMGILGRCGWRGGCLLQGGKKYGGHGIGAGCRANC